MGAPTTIKAALLAGISTSGIIARLANDMFASRTITGTTGKVTVANGDGVAGNPTLTLPAIINQEGIKFPSTQVPSADANTLDDYEEGTFTPSLSFAGAAVGVVHSTQSGTYVKIGRVVFFVARVVITNKGSSTGGAQIDGLPFAASSDIATLSVDSAANSFTGLSTGAIGATVSATSIILRQMLTTGGSAIANTAVTATMDVRVSGFYFV